MAAFVAHLESLKLQRVRTYIQSGNVVFDSTSKGIGGLATRISQRIEKRHGFCPRVLFLSAKELQSAVSDTQETPGDGVGMLAPVPGNVSHQGVAADSGTT